jgi:hypothetical protein
LLKQDTRPRLPKKTETDASDDLAKMFDDGTPLPSAKPTTGTGSTGGTGSTTSTGSALPVAPVRDFMKVANSIHREAAPAGIFKGKGKLIYDYLYSRTRGAIVPTRTVQASWREIMKAASIGSDKTLREHLKLLRAAGLITWEWSEGSQGGSIYTVFLPEETTGTRGTTGTGSTSGTFRQLLPPVPPAETTTGTGSLSSAVQTTSEISKTSFKTNIENDDDEARAALASLLKAEREVTGRNGPLSQWRELFELLATEMKISGARTSVSSAGPFLAEHLRRRLWKKGKQQLEVEAKETPVRKVKDASKCLDCGGTGYFYPDGHDKGIKFCKHERLEN